MQIFIVDLSVNYIISAATRIVNQRHLRENERQSIWAVSRFYLLFYSISSAHFVFGERCEITVVRNGTAVIAVIAERAVLKGVKRVVLKGAVFLGTLCDFAEVFLAVYHNVV